MQQSKDSLGRTGEELLSEAKRAGTEKDTRSKDVLTLLVRANMAEDHSLTDEEVLAQIPTVLSDFCVIGLRLH